MIKIKGLRRRWLINTVGIVCILGLVCVLAITAVFANYYYSAMESDMRYRARTTTEFFADYLNQNYKEYYQSCITYAQTFEDKNAMELQFINAQGRLVASSYGNWVCRSKREYPFPYCTQRDTRLKVAEEISACAITWL